MLFNLIYAVHGFLGNGADWEPLRKYLPADLKMVTPNLFSKEPVEAIPEGGNKIFLGYSFGGRLGLGLLQQDPEQFEHYIFLSTNPGLAEADISSREQRRLLDRQWAEKISPENWNNFLTEWNAQNVFLATTQDSGKDMSSFDLKKLKDALRERSLGQQPDYRSTIKKYQTKITWVVGERDRKFLALAQELKSDNIILDLVVLEAGHRLHLDAPERLADLILNLNKKRAP